MTTVNLALLKGVTVNTQVPFQCPHCNGAAAPEPNKTSKHTQGRVEALHSKKCASAENQVPSETIILYPPVPPP